jgi:hypothetical protein
MQMIMPMHPVTFLGLVLRMHDKPEAWWIAYFSANWLTALSYFIIAIRMFRQRMRGQRGAESVLFELFVSSCGAHHLLMPVGMILGFLDPLLTMDWWMASISLLAATKIGRPEPSARVT